MAADYILTLAEGATLFNNPGLINNTGSAAACWNAGNAVLIDDPLNSGRSTVLEILHFKDMWGLGQSDIATPVPSGIQNRFLWDGGDQTDIYAAIDLAVPANYIFPPSTHMMQIRGIQSGINNAGTYMHCRLQMDSYSEPLNRLVPNGSLGLYFTDDETGTYDYPRTYYFNPIDPTDPKIGNAGTPAEHLSIVPGRFYRIEYRLKVNNPASSSNGLMQAWVNGKLVLDLQNRKWRGNLDPSNEWTTGEFATWTGGNSQEFANAQDQSIYFDNMIVSTSPITH